MKKINIADTSRLFHASRNPVSPQKNPPPSPPEYESYAKSKPTSGAKALTGDAEQVGPDAQTRQRSSHGCVGHFVNTSGMLRMRAETFCTFSYIYIMWTLCVILIISGNKPS